MMETVTNTTPSFLITRYALQREYNKTHAKKILLDYFLENYEFKLTFKQKRIYVEVDQYNWALPNYPVFNFNMYDLRGNLIEYKKCLIDETVYHLLGKYFTISIKNYIIREIKQKLICEYRRPKYKYRNY